MDIFLQVIVTGIATGGVYGLIALGFVLRTMTNLSEMGAIIAPSMPAFYAEPQTIDDIITQSVARLLDLFDIDAGKTRRWGEDLKGGKRRPVKPTKPTKR